jgi:hypothetical protein
VDYERALAKVDEYLALCERSIGIQTWLEATRFTTTRSPSGKSATGASRRGGRPSRRLLRRWTPGSSTGCSPLTGPTTSSTGTSATLADYCAAPFCPGRRSPRSLARKAAAGGGPAAPVGVGPRRRAVVKWAPPSRRPGVRYVYRHLGPGLGSAASLTGDGGRLYDADCQQWDGHAEFPSRQRHSQSLSGGRVQRNRLGSEARGVARRERTGPVGLVGHR